MYVYILRCYDNSFYTGIACDIERRIKQHVGILHGGAKYTRSHPIKNIEVIWKTDESYARRLEYAIKRLTRTKKQQLISNPTEIISDFFPQFSECEAEVVEVSEYNKNFKHYFFNESK